MIVQTTTKPTRINAPMFIGARVILAGEAKLAGVMSEVADTVENVTKQFIDACHAAGVPKNEQGCDALGKSIMDALTEAIREALPNLAGISKAEAESLREADVWLLGPLNRKTMSQYALGAKRAFYFGIDWMPSLKNDKTRILPWSTKGGSGSSESAGKAGKVESTDRAALDATLSKALKQARMLGLGGFAADMEALCADCLDGFKLSTEE